MRYRYAGKVLNGPLAGLFLRGMGGFYEIGGLEYDPRPGMQVTPCPLGKIWWDYEKQGWSWADREPDALEARWCEWRNKTDPPE